MRFLFLSISVHAIRASHIFIKIPKPDCIMYKLKTNIFRRVYYCCKNFVPERNLKEETMLKNFKEIPGPRSFPFIGSLHNYLPIIGDYKAEALHENALLNWRRYGPMVREELLPGTSLLHLFDPVDIEAMFRQEGRLPARRSHLAMEHYRLGDPSTYNTGGLLATNGSDWWRLRSTFQKNFSSPSSVRLYVQSTDMVVQEFMDWIKLKQPQQSDDFLMYFNRLNLEIIGQIAFGEKFNSFSEKEQEPDSKSSKMISAAFDSNSGIFKLDKGFIWKRINTPLYSKLVEAQSYLASIAKQILLKKAKYFKQYSKESSNHECLVDLFLQQPNIDLKDITGMLVDILMAGIDTTSYSISFTCYHLAQNPKYQQEVFNEAKKLLPNKNTVITSDILTKATYVKSCVKESLRLNPVSIGVGRILQKEITLRGYIIPENTVIVTQNMIASRLPQFVKDPMSFHPTRWQRDSALFENLHPFLSLPFGFGPRSCIARRLAEQTICITLFRILRDYELKWCGGNLGVRTHLINKPDKPITLKLIPRPD